MRKWPASYRRCTRWLRRKRSAGAGWMIGFRAIQGANGASPRDTPQRRGTLWTMLFRRRGRRLLRGRARLETVKRGVHLRRVRLHLRRRRRGRLPRPPAPRVPPRRRPSKHRGVRARYPLPPHHGRDQSPARRLIPNRTAQRRRSAWSFRRSRCIRVRCGSRSGSTMTNRRSSTSRHRDAASSRLGFRLRHGDLYLPPKKLPRSGNAPAPT